jgi:hypothetical protein
MSVSSLMISIPVPDMSILAVSAWLELGPAGIGREFGSGGLLLRLLEESGFSDTRSFCDRGIMGLNLVPPLSASGEPTISSDLCSQMPSLPIRDILTNKNRVVCWE